MDKDLKKIMRAGITSRAVASITKPDQFSANDFAYFLQGANTALSLLDAHYSEEETDVIDGAVEPTEIPTEQDAAASFADGYAEIVSRAKKYGGIDLPALNLRP